MSKNQMTTPNRLNSKEVQQLIADFPALKIPNQIAAYNANAYNIVAVSSSMSQNGTLDASFKLFTKTTSVWNRTKPYNKQAHIMGAGAQRMVVLHDPTKAVVEETDEQPNGRLTKSKKAEIDKLMEAGKGEDDKGLDAIAKDLNLTFNQVKDYIQSF
mgnify:CR=1 FL=1